MEALKAAASVLLLAKQEHHLVLARAEYTCVTTPMRLKHMLPQVCSILPAKICGHTRYIYETHLYERQD